ncbi:MAG TPA: helix-turn-helix transcriptional regulator [Gammaproteobacteria bacterium]|nr:helix-turn-helix transcriptional regulator [Gammaproteobacteria bacterium]
MSGHMKKHHISAHNHGSTLYITHRHTIYAIPKNIADKYVVDEDKKKRKKPLVSIKTIFEKLEKKYTRAGVLLKGLRLREGLSQVAFAKKINITQANLSNMENGRRSIGKVVAKRIEKVFGTNYRYFLE